MNELHYTQEREDTVNKISLEGKLDAETSAAFEDYLLGSLEGVETLILDFEKLDYISSAGLRVILMAQKKMKEQGSMQIIHVNEEIKTVLDLTSFSSVFTLK